MTQPVSVPKPSYSVNDLVVTDRRVTDCEQFSIEPIDFAQVFMNSENSSSFPCHLLLATALVRVNELSTCILNYGRYRDINQNTFSID